LRRKWLVQVRGQDLFDPVKVIASKSVLTNEDMIAQVDLLNTLIVRFVRMRISYDHGQIWVLFDAALKWM
jgi:hypothetical protein